MFKCFRHSAVGHLAGLLKNSLDEFNRDVSEFHSFIPRHFGVYEAIELILDVISKIEPSKVTFLIEKNVSHSGEIASFIRKKMIEYGIEGTGIKSRRADSKIMNTPHSSGE